MDGAEKFLTDLKNRLLFLDAFQTNFFVVRSIDESYSTSLQFYDPNKKKTKRKISLNRGKSLGYERVLDYLKLSSKS